MTGASLRCCHDLVLRTRALHGLNLQRRTLLKMALNINSEEAETLETDQELNSILDEEDSPPSGSKPDSASKSPMKVGFIKKTKNRILNGTTQDLWDKVSLEITLLTIPFP